MLNDIKNAQHLLQLQQDYAADAKAPIKNFIDSLKIFLDMELSRSAKEPEKKSAYIALIGPPKGLQISPEFEEFVKNYEAMSFNVTSILEEDKLHGDSFTVTLSWAHL